MPRIEEWWQKETKRGAIQRLAIAAVLPCPVGALLLAIYLHLGLHLFPPPGAREPLPFLLTLGMLVLTGYAFVGVQSVIYAFLMEYVVNVRARSDVAAATIGGVIGAVSALPSAGFLSAPVAGGVGLLVGLLVTLLLRSMYKTAANSAMQPTPEDGCG